VNLRGKTPEEKHFLQRYGVPDWVLLVDIDSIKRAETATTRKRHSRPSRCHSFAIFPFIDSLFIFFIHSHLYDILSLIHDIHATWFALRGHDLNCTKLTRIGWSNSN
jgi:hypothetical protein